MWHIVVSTGKGNPVPCHEWNSHRLAITIVTEIPYHVITHAAICGNEAMG